MTIDFEMTKDFARYLQSEGYALELTPGMARERFKEVFSPESLARFDTLMERREERPYTSRELYSVPSTLKEAALLFSPSGAMFAAAGQALEVQAAPFLKQAETVIDYGCGVGSFTRWLALRYPNIQFVGVDRHEGLVSIAQAAKQGGQCQYAHADEATLSDKAASCDLLLSHFGIELELPHWQPSRDELSAEDPTLVEMTYQSNLAFSPIFSSWKQVLKSSGQVVAVLRLSLFEAFVGAVQAAHDVGLPIQLEESFILDFGGMPLPVLTLASVEQELPTLDELLDWWCTHNHNVEARQLADAAAVRRYRGFHKKEVVSQEETEFQDGHFLVKELGFADEWGYIYEYATTGYRRLELVSKESLKAHDRPVFVHEQDEE